MYGLRDIYRMRQGILVLTPTGLPRDGLLPRLPIHHTNPPTLRIELLPPPNTSTDPNPTHAWLLCIRMGACVDEL